MTRTAAMPEKAAVKAACGGTFSTPDPIPPQALALGLDGCRASRSVPHMRKPVCLTSVAEGGRNRSAFCKTRTNVFTVPVENESAEGLY